jgi:hypothetical protein
MYILTMFAFAYTHMCICVCIYLCVGFLYMCVYVRCLSCHGLYGRPAV